MKSKKIKLNIKNPTQKQWKFLSIEKRKQILNSLLDENVILCIDQGYDLNFLDSVSDAEYEKARISDKYSWKKFYGQLKQFNENYLFQFNPLIQYLYQTREKYLESRRNSPVSIHSYNEEHAVDELNMLLEIEPKPTFEIKINFNSILEIEGDKIYVLSGCKIKQIK